MENSAALDNTENLLCEWLIVGTLALDYSIDKVLLSMKLELLQFW